MFIIVTLSIQMKFKRLWNTVPIELRRKIYEMYELDLLLFEYDWDIVTNDIAFSK